MPALEKVTTVEEIKEKLSSAKMAILTNFQGLNVAEMTELRKLLRGAGVDYKVYKNTLTQLAARQLGITGLDEYLVGPTALAFAKDDDLATPARIVRDFSAKHQNFRVKAGILDKRVIAPGDVVALTNLPPKDVLVAMVLGGMQAPILRLLAVLQEPVRNFAAVLKSLSEKKSSPPDPSTSSNEQENS